MEAKLEPDLDLKILLFKEWYTMLPIDIVHLKLTFSLYRSTSKIVI